MRGNYELLLTEQYFSCGIRCSWPRSWPRRPELRVLWPFCGRGISAATHKPDHGRHCPGKNVRRILCLFGFVNFRVYLCFANALIRANLTASRPRSSGRFVARRSNAGSSILYRCGKNTCFTTTPITATISKPTIS